MTAPQPVPAKADREAAATPGPWDYVPSTQYHGPYITSEYGGTIADFYVMSKRWNASTRNGGDSRPIHHMAEMADANARLAAAAPDHAMIVWALCGHGGRWEEWGDGGEFCFGGMRHATKLDGFGCPIVTPALRAAIAAAQGEG